MVRKAEVAKTSDPALEAVKLMVDKNVGSVVALENEKLAGVMTERDVLRAVAKGINLSNLRVKDVMTSNLITVTSKTPIIDAFLTMTKNKIRRLPVVDDGKWVGYVTWKDLYRWVVKVGYEPMEPPL